MVAITAEDKTVITVSGKIDDLLGGVNGNGHNQWLGLVDIHRNLRLNIFVLICIAVFISGCYLMGGYQSALGDVILTFIRCEIFSNMRQNADMYWFGGHLLSFH